MGHEGAGIVEAVGEDVTSVQPGDHIVSCPSGFCGACEQCLAGHPNLCTGGIIPRAASQAPRLSQNEASGASIEQHRQPRRAHAAARAFAGAHRRGHSAGIRAALIGCGVPDRLGAALRTSASKPGQTVKPSSAVAAVRTVDHPGRAHRRGAPDHRAGRLRWQTRDGPRRGCDTRHQQCPAGPGVATVRQMTGAARAWDHALRLSAIRRWCVGGRSGAAGDSGHGDDRGRAGRRTR